MKKHLPVLLITLIVVALDQFTKWLVVMKIPLYSKIEILPILDFTNIRNTGVAFGMLRDMPDSIRYPFFALVLILAIVAVFIFLQKLDENEKIIRFCLGLILGGALGNSIDRFRLGYVTDFLNFHWVGNSSLNWPPFNIADSAITVGAISIFIFGILFTKKEKDVHGNN